MRGVNHLASFALFSAILGLMAAGLGSASSLQSQFSPTGFQPASRSIAGPSIRDLDFSVETLTASRWEIAVSGRISPGSIDPREHDRDTLEIESLVMSLDTGFATLRLGNLTPNFGTAWALVPGTTGDSPAVDYELAGRWGVEVAVERAGHKLTLGASFTDSSPIANPLGGDGNGLISGNENASGPENGTAVTIGIDGAFPIGSWRPDYHAGLFRRATGRRGGGLERGLVLGIQTPLWNREASSLTAIIESAVLEEESGPGRATRYATVALESRIGSWFALASVSSRWGGKGPFERTLAIETTSGIESGSMGLLEVAWRSELGATCTCHTALIRVTRAFSW